MKSKKSLVLGGIVAGLLASGAYADLSNKWRLEVSGGAESDGAIAISVLGVGAVVAEVNVPIVKGTAENDVARRIRDELQLQLPKDAYAVETDDGEDVLIKKKAAREDFEVRITNNSVAGVRVNPDRE